MWARHLSEAWIITDEEGRRITRSQFLKELRPLPAGQSGRLALADWQLVARGTVVVMSYGVDEQHDFHGQHLRSRFQATVTWIREQRS